MQKGKCLIIKNDGIGDLILASGLIAGISDIFDGEVDLVTCARNKEIAENIYGLNKCFYVSRDGLRFQPLLRKLGVLSPVLRLDGEDRRVLEHLRKTRYECAVSLRRFIRQSSLILMARVRAERKYCAWQFPTNASFRDAERCSDGWIRYKGDLSTIHESVYYRDFLKRSLGSEIGLQPRLRCVDDLDKRPVPGVVGIGLSGHSCRWPVEHWVELLRSLQEKGYHLKLFGGGDVKGYAAAIAGKIGGCEDLVGKLSLADSLPHLAGLSAAICNDSGFAHLAGMIVPKCLIIMGGGTFRRFFPWPGARNQYIIYHALDCYDCTWECKYPEKICLSNIRASDVLGYFNRVMTGEEAERMFNLNPSEKSYHAAWRILPEEKACLKFQDQG